MEVININVGIYCWIIFWSTYWIVGLILSWKAHVSSVRKIENFKDVCLVLFNNMIWTFAGIIILCMLPIRANTDSHTIIKLFFTYIITDIWFYHTHCFAHNPQLYKHIHKLHHFYKKPWALTALYCTGYEAIVINLFSVGLGPILFQLPPPWLYVWFMLVAINALASHSGYSFPVLMDGAHDIHHQEFNYNFSISPYLDMLYGTYKNPSLISDKKIDSKGVGKIKLKN